MLIIEKVRVESLRREHDLMAPSESYRTGPANSNDSRENTRRHHICAPRMISTVDDDLEVSQTSLERVSQCQCHCQCHISHVT